MLNIFSEGTFIRGVKARGYEKRVALGTNKDDLQFRSCVGFLPIYEQFQGKYKFEAIMKYATLISGFVLSASMLTTSACQQPSGEVRVENPPSGSVQQTKEISEEPSSRRNDTEQSTKSKGKSASQPIDSSTQTSSKEKSSQKHTLFLVSVPKSPEQVKLMQRTLANAQADGINGATQIIQPGNRHVLVEICQHDTPDFITPQAIIQNSADAGKVTQATLKSLKLNKQCLAKPISLIEITKNFNKAALSGERLIIILQAPWARNEIDNSTITELSKSIERLAVTKKVDRLVLVGVHPDGADRLAGAFESLNKSTDGTVTIANSINEVAEQFKLIRREFLTP